MAYHQKAIPIGGGHTKRIETVCKKKTDFPGKMKPFFLFRFALIYTLACSFYNMLGKIDGKFEIE